MHSIIHYRLLFWLTFAALCIMTAVSAIERGVMEQQMAVIEQQGILIELLLPQFPPGPGAIPQAPLIAPSKPSREI